VDRRQLEHREHVLRIGVDGLLEVPDGGVEITPAQGQLAPVERRVRGLGQGARSAGRRRGRGLDVAQRGEILQPRLVDWERGGVPLPRARQVVIGMDGSPPAIDA
jgi:hypothetical protein